MNFGNLYQSDLNMSSINSHTALFLSIGNRSYNTPKGEWLIVLNDVVAIDRQGKVVYLGDYTPDEAAKEFWTAITKNFQNFIK